jgi:hypothetical protein
MTSTATVVLMLASIFALGACASSPRREAAERAAQDREAILQVVQAFFDTMTARDADAAERLLIAEGVFVSVRIDPETRARSIRKSSNAEYVAQLRTGAEILRETMFDPLVLVEGDVATVWTRYTFERSGALSHTGYDAFNLVRTPQGWKIAGGVYSVVPPISGQ